MTRRRRLKTLWSVIAYGVMLCVALILFVPTGSQAKIIPGFTDIDIRQQGNEWCWAAAAQIILDYYRVPVEPDNSLVGLCYDYLEQCTIVDYVYPQTMDPHTGQLIDPCANRNSTCVSPSVTDRELLPPCTHACQDFAGGPDIVHEGIFPHWGVLGDCSHACEPVTMDEVIENTDNGTPWVMILTGTGPDAYSHAVVGVGYERADNFHGDVVYYYDPETGLDQVEYSHIVYSGGPTLAMWWTGTIWTRPGPTTCTRPDYYCQDGCVDVETNADHCGECGNRCAPSEVCCEGGCRGVDSFTTDDHCGDCGAACLPNEEVCCEGSCRRIDSFTTDDHCGECGRRCPDDMFCNAGICEAKPGPEDHVIPGMPLARKRGTNWSWAAATQSVINFYGLRTDTDPDAGESGECSDYRQQCAILQWYFKDSTDFSGLECCQNAASCEAIGTCDLPLAEDCLDLCAYDLDHQEGTFGGILEHWQIPTDCADSDPCESLGWFDVLQMTGKKTPWLMGLVYADSNGIYRENRKFVVGYGHSDSHVLVMDPEAGFTRFDFNDLYTQNGVPGDLFWEATITTKYPLTCAQGLSLCDGQCADVTSDVYNCGTCGKKCGQDQFCCAGECRPWNWFQNNDQHCGRCGEECSTTESCCEGECRPDNWYQQDDENCGLCGASCGTGEACCQGQCLEEALLMDDRNNCGQCGVVCGAEEDCYRGTCLNRATLQSDPENCGSWGNRCPEGETCCGGECLDPSLLESDVHHCGSCENSCADSSSFWSKQGCCGGDCKNLLFDKNNCGACGRQCTGSPCVMGRCMPVYIPFPPIISMPGCSAGGQTDSAQPMD